MHHLGKRVEGKGIYIASIDQDLMRFSDGPTLNDVYMYNNYVGVGEPHSQTLPLCV